MRGGAKDHCLGHGERGFDITQNHRGGAVGDERAIGALERAPGHKRIFVRDVAAEIIAQALLDLGQWIVCAVLVVLGRDLGQGIALIAVALKIILGNGAEHTGKAALDIGLFFYIRGAQQVFADSGALCIGHFLDADHQHETGAFGLNRFDTLINGGTAGRASILNPGRRDKAVSVIGLQGE